MSRTYITTSIIEELEKTVGQMFNAPVLVYSRVSTAHISLIPTSVDRRDAIILDQQCHFSIQTAAQLQRQKGVTIDMVKHNNLEMLEAKLKVLSKTHRKIWYMADGVYSMFGDVAPMQELIKLVEQYPQLWLYIDDAHGMSWCGPNGTGYVMNIVPMHEQLVLVTTMSKGFGVHGGIAVFPNEELHRKVKVFGGPLSYSLPLSPADIGACLASTRIHLSDEIYAMQRELKERMEHCNDLLDAADLPVISNPGTPIYFIAMGQPQTGYNMVSRLLDEGIYLNPSFFPMVPVKSTGLRFGLTRNHRLEDLKELVDAIAYHFPLALEEEGRTLEQVHRAFRLPLPKVKGGGGHKRTSSFSVAYAQTIDHIDADKWNACMANAGTVNEEGMRFLEETFSGNDREETNWKFHYYLIEDREEQPVVATFFVESLVKDDFLSDASISRQIEAKRKNDPHHLVSKALATASTITEGEHLYINRNHPEWKGAMDLLLDRATELKESVKADQLVFGEFKKGDTELNQYFHSKGFFKVDMPNSNEVLLDWNDFDGLLKDLPKVHRENVKREALRYEDRFDVKVKDQLSKEEAAEYYGLFINVKRRNLGLNFFDYPPTILETMSQYPSWEFIILRLKPEYDPRAERKAVAVLWCFKGVQHYSPMIIGMDYTYNTEFKVYKQALYRTVLRAKELEKKKIYFGFSADTEKKKFGAKQVAKVAYVQAEDNFKMELIESMGVEQSGVAQ